jgi:hypothetical protein
LRSTLETKEKDKGGSLQPVRLPALWKTVRNGSKDRVNSA